MIRIVISISIVLIPLITFATHGDVLYTVQLGWDDTEPPYNDWGNLAP